MHTILAPKTGAVKSRLHDCAARVYLFRVPRKKRAQADKNPETKAAKPKAARKRSHKPAPVDRRDKVTTPRGGWSLLTDELIDGLVEAVSLGVYLAHAGPAFGVSAHTIYHWQHQGRIDIADGKTDTPHARLESGIQRARCSAAMNAHKIIAKAAIKDWKAAAWLIERQWPHLYSRQADDVAQGRAHGLAGSLRAELDPRESADELDTLSDAELESLAELHNRELSVYEAAKRRARSK